MNKVKLLTWSELPLVAPTYAFVANVDLVVVRWPDGEQVSVLYGRCLHRGALLADGGIRGHNHDETCKQFEEHQAKSMGMPAPLIPAP